MVGSCTAKTSTTVTFNLYVVGRDQTLANYHYDSLSAAIYEAYWLQDSCSNATVNIYLSIAVEHYVILTDVATY